MLSSVAGAIPKGVQVGVQQLLNIPNWAWGLACHSGIVSDKYVSAHPNLPTDFDWRRFQEARAVL